MPGGCVAVGLRGGEGSLLSCQTALWAPRRDGPLLSTVYSTPRGDLNALLIGSAICFLKGILFVSFPLSVCSILRDFNWY